MGTFPVENNVQGARAERSSCQPFPPAAATSAAVAGVLAASESLSWKGEPLRRRRVSGVCVCGRCASLLCVKVIGRILARQESGSVVRAQRAAAAADTEVGRPASNSSAKPSTQAVTAVVYGGGVDV